MTAWMNVYEVASAAERFVSDPVLGPATEYLKDYMDVVNDNSDGWAYWSAGTKCAGNLILLISGAIDSQRRYNRDYVEPTRADVVKAAKKIENFVQSNKFLKEQGAKPPVLAAAV